MASDDPYSENQELVESVLAATIWRHARCVASGVAAAPNR